MSLHDDIKKYGGIRPAARALGLAESTIRYRLKAEAKSQFGSYSLPSAGVYPARSDRPRYFIFSSAQDGTDVHESFLGNLELYAEWLGDCELLIGGFTYNKRLFEENNKKSDKIAYHPRVEPYLMHDRIDIGEGLVFCGEMNTLPTAVTPLSGFETYTRHKWGVFPHPKVQLLSVPTQKNALTKILMTTGAVTMPNYIRKKAGIKAAFHHICGAVIVELLPDGSFFCRQIQANNLKDGSFYDLDRFIGDGAVTTGQRAEALTYGDIHHEKLDPSVAKTTWTYDVTTGRNIDYGTNQSLLDFLRPKFQFFHDLSDFSPRNHHNIKDHHFLFSTHQKKTGNVAAALAGCGRFLGETSRPWCQSVVVQSNHDNALVKWLKNADYREDPENAIYFLEKQLEFYQDIAKGISDPPIFERAMRSYGAPDEVIFVGEDDSFITCGDIENAMHGHLGANGARATPRQFTKMGPKANTGHTHSAGITDGIYTSGVSGSLDMGYNKGLSSWTHSHTLTYANGKRAILTMMGGRWFA